MDQTWVDDLHVAIADSDIAARRAATPARSTPRRGRGWHHAKWIAINLVLIAATAYVYRYYLIPRFIMGESPAVTANAPVREPASVPARLVNGESTGLCCVPAQTTLQPGETVADWIVREERRQAAPVLAARRSDARNADYYTRSAAESLGYKCSGGIAYRIREINGVTHVEADGSMRCR